jgi:RNA polymerase sigma-70 factor (ECF subfamily)
MDEQTRTREAWLALRFQSGDATALAELVEALHPPLLYYATKLTGNFETAKDVLQEAWIRASRDIDRLQNPSAIRSWLYRIVHGIAVDRIRRDLNRESVEEELHEESVSIETDPVIEESAEVVHRGLDRLRPKHREVLALFFLEDFSISEISAIVNCSEGTVKSRLHHAKAALRETLRYIL